MCVYVSVYVCVCVCVGVCFLYVCVQGTCAYFYAHNNVLVHVHSVGVHDIVTQ